MYHILHVFVTNIIEKIYEQLLSNIYFIETVYR